MKRINRIIVLALLAGMVVFASCNRNYYSGTGKGSSCGCPSHKGMSGY